MTKLVVLMSLGALRGKRTFYINGVLASSVMRRLAILLLVLGSRPSHAWWNEGHILVTRIAEGLLTRDIRARIAATLAPGESLAELSIWADDVRPLRKETEPWHYVNIPLGSAGLDMRRDCPASDCIVGKIAEFRKSWSNPAVHSAARREALLFLIHFVGDLHQPLHCADNGDAGGNHLPVEFLGQRTNLHALWDGLLLEHIRRRKQLWARLQADLTRRQAAEWSRGTVQEWANESFSIARRTVYGGLPISFSYRQMAEPVIERQLEKAGVRLAAILNGTAP